MITALLLALALPVQPASAPQTDAVDAAQSSLDDAWLDRRLRASEAERLAQRFAAREKASSQALTSVQAARAHFWHGLLLERAGKSTAQRKRAFEAAVASARRARERDINEPGGPFWEATARAKLAELRGIFASAWELPDLIDLMEEVDRLEPGYANGGTDRFWGAVITKTPGILLKMQGKSLDDGDDFFKSSLKKNPRFVGTLVYRAQLARRKGDDRQAAVQLQKAVRARKSDDRKVEAWNRYYRDVAKRELAALR